MKKTIVNLNQRTLTVYLIAMLAGCLLLYTSQNVQIQQDNRSALTQTLTEENNHIKMLEAEWAYLNSPERLERLVEKYMPPSSEIMPSAALKADMKSIPMMATDPVVSLIESTPESETISQEAGR